MKGGRGNCEGDNREVGDWEGQRGGGDGEGGNEKGEMGIQRGQWVREGKEVGQAHGMPGWNEVTVFPDFAYPCNAGYPR